MKFMKSSMFLMKLIFQNEAKYLTQKFVNKTKSFLPGGKADMYFSFFPYKNKEIFHGEVLNFMTYDL